MGNYFGSLHCGVGGSGGGGRPGRDGGVMNFYCGVLLGAVLFGAGALVAFLGLLKAWSILKGEQQRKRQTTNTEAGLLDAMADLNYAEFDLIEIRSRIDTALQKVDLAKKRTGIVRRDPYGYPKDGRLEVDDERQ